MKSGVGGIIVGIGDRVRVAVSTIAIVGCNIAVGDVHDISAIMSPDSKVRRAKLNTPRISFIFRL